jgi:hypothetical protein
LSKQSFISFHSISQNQDDEKAVKFLTVFPFNRFTLKSKCDVRDLLPIEYLSFVKMSRKKGLFLYDQQKRLFYNVNFSKDKSKLKCETLFGKTRQNFYFEFFILLFLINVDFKLFVDAQKVLKVSNRSECVKYFGSRVCRLASHLNLDFEDLVSRAENSQSIFTQLRIQNMTYN